MAKRVVSLGPTRWLSMVEVAASAVVLEWRLRRWDIVRVAQKMGVATEDGGAAPSGDLHLSPQEAREVADVRRVLTYGPFNGTCLRQSLLVGHVLRRRSTVLRIGVRKTSGVVKAHAWLLVDGHCVDSYGVVEDPGFVVMPIANAGMMR